MIRLSITRGLGIDFRDSAQPVITNAAISTTSIGLDGTVVASCKASHSPQKVVVEINGKAFLMTNTSLDNWSLTLTGYVVGLCTASPVAFYAVGATAGSKRVVISDTLSVVDSLSIDNVKTRLYALLSTDITLQALLGGTPTDTRIYHIKKPTLVEAGEKLVVFNEITSTGRRTDEYITDEYYQITIESDDPDFNDRVYERINDILLNYNWSTSNLVGHRIVMDWKSPDILQADDVTWQLQVRYAIMTERRN